MGKKQVVFADAAESIEQVEARTVSSFKMGEKIIGFYKSSRVVQTSNGPGTIYTFVDSNDYAEDLGTITDIWKSGGLNIERTSIKENQLCMITYEGMKTNAKTNRKFGAFLIQPANHFLEVIKVVPAPAPVEEDLEFDDIEWED